jgi:hypothetical protein
MTTGTQEHWTGDQELLAHYVLERIPAGARVPLDAHLAACEQCRTAVADERLLAAGARLAGRRQIRRSLAGNIRSRPRATPPWPRIFAAAAVIVIAGALVLYSRWMAVEQERLQESRRANDQAIPAPGPAQTSPGVPAGKLERKSTPSPAEGPGTVGRTEMPQHLKKDAGAAAAAAPKVTAGEPDAPGGQGAWWTGKHVLPGGRGDSVLSDVRPSAGNEKSEAFEMDAAAVTTRETFVLHQRPFSDLAAGKEKSSAGLDRRDVPIRVERREGRTHLTLYTAAPFDPAQLQAARIRVKPDGSMTITIGDETIVVRVPPETVLPAAKPPLRRR